MKKSTWVILEQESSVNIAGHAGSFTLVYGTVLAGEKLEETEIVLYLHSASLQSETAGVREILLSGAYFDAENYPMVLLNTYRIGQPEQRNGVLTAALNIKGNIHRIDLQIGKRELKEAGAMLLQLAGTADSHLFELDQDVHPASAAALAITINLKLSRQVLTPA